METPMKDSAAFAEVLLPSQDLRADLDFFTEILGMRLDSIYPADDPVSASLSGHGLRITIQKNADVSPGIIRIRTDDLERFTQGDPHLVAPNGTVVEVTALTENIESNGPGPMEIHHEFVIRRLYDEAPWIVGRADMHYRDLIPFRLGGAVIASHIRIPGGGPIPDQVHFHTVSFQLIFCYRGWVDVLYEDQGEMIHLHAGDCVTQPPGIRHRVCFASEDIEVIEIGVPAMHTTTIDHEMTLPTAEHAPDRQWQQQKFVHHIAEKADWQPFRLPGFICRETGVSEGTGGIANVQVARYEKGNPPSSTLNTDVHFTFITKGRMSLNILNIDDNPNCSSYDLGRGDSFVLPPLMTARYNRCSDDLELLEVTVQGYGEMHKRFLNGDISQRA